MKRFSLPSLLVALLWLFPLSAAWAAGPKPVPLGRGQGVGSLPADGAQDANIEVTVILPDGKSIVYAREVRTVQLVLDAQGRLSLIHLILAKGGETDTHEWYTFQNIAGFSYRFLEITGRSKVSVVQMREIAPEREGQDKVPALRPENYL